MRWAMSQPVEKSSAKFLLVAMADCVNGEGAEMLCWPSVKYLSDATCQDRKTVMDGLRRLRDTGFVKDTGNRKGITGQVAVYLLKSPENGTVKPSTEPVKKPESDASNSTEIGTGTENGTVPNFPPNSTEIPSQQYQISLVTVPKTGHGTKKEPVKNQEGTRKKSGGFDASLIDLPEWLDRADWTRWVSDRKTRGKAITEEAAKLQLQNLGNYRKDGFTPKEVIEHSIASTYTGLFPPSRKGKPKTPSRHSGFRDFDYEEGLTDGTPDA
jgi:hypothetical protein